MTSPEGGFYSAGDADSGGEEGAFFVWTPEEIGSILGPERARLFNARYGVTQAGNFEGKNVLHISRPLAEVAVEHGVSRERARAILREAREALLAARNRRVLPLKDRKVQASWNGLMISAFATAAQVLAEPRYAEAAARTADFILTRMRPDGRLRHSFFEGALSQRAYLNDHAFLAAGLLDLYEATFDPRWIREAVALHRVLEERFWDEGNGGFFMTGDRGGGV